MRRTSFISFFIHMIKLKCLWLASIFLDGHRFVLKTKNEASVGNKNNFSWFLTLSSFPFGLALVSMMFILFLLSMNNINKGSNCDKWRWLTQNKSNIKSNGLLYIAFCWTRIYYVLIIDIRDQKLFFHIYLFFVIDHLSTSHIRYLCRKKETRHIPRKYR